MIVLWAVHTKVFYLTQIPSAVLIVSFGPNHSCGCKSDTAVLQPASLCLNTMKHAISIQNQVVPVIVPKRKQYFLPCTNEGSKYL